MESLKLRLSADLKKALKERDAVAVKTIRSLMSALDNAGAVPIEIPKIMPMTGGIAGATDGLGSSEVSRKELFHEEIIKIIQNEISEINNTIILIGDHSDSVTEQLKAQMNLLKKYL